MSLKERLQTETTAAMRSGDALRRDVLRMASNAIYLSEKRQGKPLDEAEEIAIVGREVKTRRESVEAYQSAGRTDLADKELAEIAILAEFLPAALSEDELEALVHGGDRRHRRDLPARSRQGHGLALAADPRPGRRQGPERAGRQPSRGSRPGDPRRGRQPLTG